MTTTTWNNVHFLFINSKTEYMICLWLGICEKSLATARVVHMVCQNDIFQLSSSFMHTENTARRAFKWKKGECVGNIKNSIKNPRDNHANAHVNGKHTNLPSNALKMALLQTRMCLRFLVYLGNWTNTVWIESMSCLLDENPLMSQ